MPDNDRIADSIQRYRSLLEPATLPRPAPQGDELNAGDMGRLAQLVGPTMAAVHAAGVCAELLGAKAGVPAEQLEEARMRTVATDEPPTGRLDETSSPRVILIELLLLHQTVIADVSDLAGELAVTRRT